MVLLLLRWHGKACGLGGVVRLNRFGQHHAQDRNIATCRSGRGTFSMCQTWMGSISEST